MILPKKTMIISASAASLLLLIAIVAFIWLRMAKLPSTFNIAAEADKKTMDTAKPMETIETQVTRKKMPPPPKTTEVESMAPVPEEIPVPAVIQPDAPKPEPSLQLSEIKENIDEPAPIPPNPEMKLVPETESPAAAPPLKTAPKKREAPKTVSVSVSVDDFLFSVQVGAFLEKQNADERMIILNQMGHTPFGYDAMDKRGNLWYTVRIGRFQSLEDARKELASIKRSSPFKAIIIGKDTLGPLKKYK